MWDLGEAEVGIEAHRGGTAERVQPVSIALLSQEHQVLQELDAQTKQHQTHPRVDLPTTAHGAEHPPGSLNL